MCPHSSYPHAATCRFVGARALAYCLAALARLCLSPHPQSGPCKGLRSAFLRLRISITPRKWSRDLQYRVYSPLFPSRACAFTSSLLCQPTLNFSSPLPFLYPSSLRQPALPHLQRRAHLRASSPLTNLASSPFCARLHSPSSNGFLPSLSRLVSPRHLAAPAPTPLFRQGWVRACPGTAVSLTQGTSCASWTKASSRFSLTLWPSLSLGQALTLCHRALLRVRVRVFSFRPYPLLLWTRPGARRHSVHSHPAGRGRGEEEKGEV